MSKAQRFIDKLCWRAQFRCTITTFAGEDNSDVHCQALLASTVQMPAEYFAGGLLRLTLSNLAGEPSSVFHCQRLTGEHNSGMH